MVLMLNSLGVISNESINNINSVADNPEFDTYTVQIIAQDDITAGNPYGAELNGQYYYCKVDFINNTKETTTTEQFVFDKIPNNEEMLEAISLKVKQLKKLSNQ